MCRAVTCTVCGKTTWAGCGQHVAEVRRTVPAAQWCASHPDGVAATPPIRSGGFLSRLLSR